MLTFIRYIEVYYTLLDCVRYNENFVKSGFFFSHFIVILAGLNKIVRYHIWRAWYNGSYAVMAKPIRALELHYPMIQFSIKYSNI